MELLKNKIDKTSQCAMFFSHTKWIISLNDIQCDTPTSSYDDIQYFGKDPNPICNVKDPIGDIKDPDDIKDCINDIKDPIGDIKDIKDPICNIKDIKAPIDDIKDFINDVKDPIDDIKINKIENKDIGPLDFFKQSLDLYEDDDIIKNKLFTFISTQKISNKYTKKGVSMIMDGITQNKWNIYICKLFSFLLDISFEYRKQNICYTNNSRFIIKK